MERCAVNTGLIGEEGKEVPLAIITLNNNIHAFGMNGLT